MALYSIHPIALCEGPRDLSSFTYRQNVGTATKSVCYVWYIEGSQPKILVDTGVRPSYFTEKGIPETELISVEDGLARLGLKPEDIQIVIPTHLHADHMALSYLYKKATFIVQKRELDYALNPHPIDAFFYDKSFFEDLNMEVIDGPKEIIPGVSVFLSPGHTPGGQSVEVITAAGKAVITGFCAMLANFVQNETMKQFGWEVVPSTIHNDDREAYDSMLEIKHRADIILPLHEPSFVGKGTIP